MRFAVALLVVIGCVTPARYLMAPHPDRATQIPEPAMLVAQPWTVGQWASYASRRRGDLSYEWIAVVAEDVCGIWIETIVQTARTRHRWFLCFASTGASATDRLQEMIVETDHGAPTTIDFRNGSNAGTKHDLENFIHALEPPSSLDGATLVREDVTVPAGHFAQAIRTQEQNGTAQVTRWLQPEVPFDATVKLEASDGREFVLLDYGQSRAKSVLQRLTDELAIARGPRRLPWLFWSLGFGVSGFSGKPGEPFSRAYGPSGVLGFRVARTLDVVYGSSLIDIRYTPDPTRSQQAGMVLAGLRWSPRRAPLYQPYELAGLAGLYVQGDLGYAELDRSAPGMDTETVGRGLAMGVTLGLLGLRRHDFTAGIEVSDHLIFLDHSERMRQGIGANLFVQLYLP
jgi:hypothetical protein